MGECGRQAGSQRPVPKLKLLVVVEAYDKRLAWWQTGMGRGQPREMLVCHPNSCSYGGFLIRFMRA